LSNAFDFKTKLAGIKPQGGMKPVSAVEKPQSTFSRTHHLRRRLLTGVAQWTGQGDAEEIAYLQEQVESLKAERPSLIQRLSKPG
jgi:hypothetical protein